MSEAKLVAIVGSGRNGSTLISRLLDGIPGAYMHPVEANFLAAFDDLARFPVVRRATIQNAVSHKLRRLGRRIPTDRLMRFYAAHEAEIEQVYLPELEPGTIRLGRKVGERMAEQAGYTAAAFVPAFLAAHAAWLGQPGELLIFKTIETPYVADYERLFPGMRFIHIVRDPVDTWASQKRSLHSNKALPSWYLGGDSFRATIEYRWVPHAEAVLARRGDKRHFVIRYEDLVADAGARVREICAWLGVAPPAEPDTQTLFGGHHPRRVASNPSQKGVETPRHAVADLHQRFAFDPVVSERERDFIRLRTAALAGPLGYGGGGAPDPASVRAAWRGRDEWDFKNTAGLASWMLSLYCYVGRRRYVARHCGGTHP